MEILLIKNKNGFTLIEIVVLLIIIGVLAAIALPNLFSNVQKARGSAAIAEMDGIKTSIEMCFAQNPSLDPFAAATYQSACTPAQFGLASDNGFTFALAQSGASLIQTNTSGAVISTRPGTSFGAGNLEYSIVATDATGQMIVLNRDANGNFSCSAPLAGPYAGLC